MSETIVDIQSLFSTIASKYDILNTILTLNIDQKWRKKAINICKLQKNHSVLDLCCGTGQMVEYECKAVGKNTEVIGLDFTEKMIEIGYKKLSKPLQDYKFSLVKGDILEIPFEDNVFLNE
jgi:demethylmenaquinone methyltransferase/2-methoxy-6-polyprenyl-1,4-benzoquinol methylase